MKKKADIWMPIYIGDYLGDTGRLTTEGHGAYLLLLMDYWRHGPPPDDDETLAAICKLPMVRWKKIRPLIAAFFTIDAGVWHQGRADAEMAKARGNSDERSKAGKAGAQSRWGSDKPEGKEKAKQMANAIAKPSQNDGPSPSPSPSEGKPSGAEAPPVAALPRQASLLPSISDPHVGMPLHMIQIDLDAGYAGPLWKHGLAYVAEAAKKSPESCRTIFGKWCKELGDDHQALWTILVEAQRAQKGDVVSWVTACVKTHKPGAGAAASDDGLTPAVREILRNQEAQKATLAKGAA